MRLGDYAQKQNRFEDAIFFWKEAGLDIDGLKEIAELTMKDARDTSSSGIQIANVLPHPSVMPEGKHAGSSDYLQPLPDWMVTKHGATLYVRATDDFIVPFRRGDLILVDSSETSQSILLGGFVVAYRPNHFSNEERAKLERHWAKHLSTEEARRRRDRRQFPFLRTGIFVARLTTGGTFGGARAIEYRTDSGDTLLEYLRPNFRDLLVPENDAEREIIEKIARSTSSSGHIALKPEGLFHRYADLQILGRAIGWLSAPVSDVPHKKELKK